MSGFCPACGEPFEHDGDRIWNDSCMFCGWATADRKAADRLNTAIFAHARAVEIVARTLYNVQTNYDRECGYAPGANEAGWEDARPDIQAHFRSQAESVVVSREPVMRQRLIGLRKRQREGTSA